MNFFNLPSVLANRVLRGTCLLIRFAAPAAAAFLAAGAAAADATWTNVTEFSAGWYVAANWTNAEGNVLSVAPTNGEDVTFAAITNTPFFQRISTGKTSASGNVKYLTPSTAVDVTIGKLTGPADRTIRVAEETSGSQSQLIRLFSVADPNGFLGFWEPGDGKVNLELRATETFTPVMANVSAIKRPFVAVPNAGTTAEIVRVHQTGALQKKGAGSLVVRETACEETRVYVDEGEVTFATEASPVDLTALLSEAVLDLDASAAGTLTTYVDPADGRTCITNWADAAGRSLYARCPVEKTFAASSLIPYVRPPFLCADTSPTGLPLVDFGSLAALDGTTLGPTNCVMILSRSQNVREAFYVIDAPVGLFARTVLCGDTDYSFMAEGDYMFCGYVTTDKVYNGDIRVNGERMHYKDRLAKELLGMFTVSVGTTANAPVSQIGTRQYYAAHTGGMRIGEIILFDRVLSHAERNAVNAHLRKKWLTGEDSSDSTGVFLASGTRLGVAEGKMARVRRVKAEAALVKTGAGELETGFIRPASAPVELRGGSLKITSRAFPEETNSPAPGAYVWLDATRDDTFTTSAGVGDGKVYIEEWNDCRAGTAVKATCLHKTPGMPFKAYDPGVGRQVVDFGLRLTSTTCGTQSSMGLPLWNKASRDTFAGFCVFRQTAPISKGTSPVFGCSGMDTYRDATQLVSPSYVNGFCSAAAWALDGEAVNPWLSQSRLEQTNDFVVVAFSSQRPLVVDGLSQDRVGNNIYTNYCGNMQVGEYILYHRPLSDVERIRTEAYLMNKWLGKAHPETASTAKLEKVSLHADGTGLGSDIPLEVSRLTGTVPGNGAFTKTGTGTLNIQFFEVENLRALTVEGGTLSFTPSDFKDGSAFHFDASAADSFTTTLTDNGATTNVLNWADTRGNGLTTYCPISANAPGEVNGQLVFTNPVLRVLEMRPGIFRPAVDFGSASGHYTNTQSAGSSGLSFSYNGATANARFTNIREAFSVFSDRGSARNWIFCDSSAFHYHRAGSQILTDNAAPDGTQAGTKDGYHAVDGVAVAWNYALPSGFHVVNFAPTNNTAISRFAFDRTSNGGGSYIAESIGFSNVLSVTRRKYMESYLMHKWFETPAPVWTNALDEVTVVGGASLVTGGTDVLAVSRISGSGSITAAEVTGVSELAFTSDASGHIDALSLNGELSFAPTVSVEVAFADPDSPVLGDHPLVVATALGETNVRAWTLTTNLSSAYSAFLIRQNNTVLLRIIPKGLIVILR